MACFDLEDLSTITPVVCQCVKCLALFHTYDISTFLVGQEQPVVYERDCHACQAGQRHHHPTCPFCGVRYLPTRSYHWANIHAYLIKHTRPTWPFSILDQSSLPAFLHHCWRFGHSIARIDNAEEGPVMGLLKILGAAQSFVHFVSCSPLAHEVLGALLILAQRIPVRGMSTLQGTGKPGIFNRLSLGTPSFWTGICEPDQVRRMTSYEHTFIIDGVVALQGNFCGSFHEHSIAQAGKPTFAATTALDSVTTLNNELFSRLWAKRSNYGDAIPMI